MRRFALHYRSDQPIPEALLERLLAAKQFNQGFATVEYTASALVDLALHCQKPAEDLDIIALEKDMLEKLGMPKSIVMRHRTPHFTHVFSGDSYSAGYYSYLWSEVLDADGFDAFIEAGDIFDAEVAKKLLETCLCRRQQNRGGRCLSWLPRPCAFGRAFAEEAWAGGGDRVSVDGRVKPGHDE